MHASRVALKVGTRKREIGNKKRGNEEMLGVDSLTSVGAGAQHRREARVTVLVGSLTTNG